MTMIDSPTRRKPYASCASIGNLSTFAIVLVLSGLLGGCGRLNEEQPSAAQQTPESAEARPMLQPLLTAMLAPTDESAGERAISRLPIAASVEHEHVQNRHDPQSIDTVKSLRYDGLSVAIYEVTESSKSLLWAITVNQGGLGSGDLKVGRPLAAVISQLGDPVATSEDTLTYLMTESAGSPYRLTIKHSDQLVESLEWRIILD